MYVVAIIAAFIAAISPFGGMIFTLAYGGKYREHISRFLFAMLFASALMLIIGIVEIVTFSDIILGIAIAVFIYFYVFRKTGNYQIAFLSAYIFNVFYAALRQMLLGAQIAENVNRAAAVYRQILESSFQNNPQQTEIAQQFVELSQQIFTRYYIGIWAVTIALGLYLGTLLVSRSNEFKWQHKSIRMPFETIYFLLAALILFLIPNSRELGINALAILAPLFLIQGISILDFFWGNFFKKSKILLFLLIISMVFNYFILSLIALIGLLDVWFDFRKINNMEDIDESHTS